MFLVSFRIDFNIVNDSRQFLTSRILSSLVLEQSSWMASCPRENVCSLRADAELLVFVSRGPYDYQYIVDALKTNKNSATTKVIC